MIKIINIFVYKFSVFFEIMLFIYAIDFFGYNKLIVEHGLKSCLNGRASVPIPPRAGKALINPDTRLPLRVKFKAGSEKN